MSYGNKHTNIPKKNHSQLKTVMYLQVWLTFILEKDMRILYTRLEIQDESWDYSVLLW